MHWNHDSQPSRSGVFRALALSLPFALAGVGLAATEPPAAKSETPAAPAAESGWSGEQVPPQARRGESRRQFRERQFRERSHREGRSRDRNFRDRGYRFRGGGPGDLWWHPRTAAQLDLTDEQREQLREVLRASRDQQRDSRRQIADAQRAFRQAARDPERSAEELRALGETLGRAQAEAVVQRRAGRDRLAAILTAEQRTRLEELRQNRGDRDGRNRRDGRGQRLRRRG